MKAGFSRVKITPPLGTTMMGFGARDMEHGCSGVHDDIYVRAVYAEQSGEAALIMGFDLCFLGRVESDRFKGAIGRVLDLAPRQILLNTTHNHVGPSVGIWYSAGFEPPDRLYLEELERATVQAAGLARGNAQEVTLWAGQTRSALPMNRRRPSEDGKIYMRPNPPGLVYDKIPMVLFKNLRGDPVCLLFSVSAHPSMMSGFEISAEYPGAIMTRLDRNLGQTVSLFLQGVGGDAKPSVIGGDIEYWRPGTWELMDQAGAMVAAEIRAALDNGLQEIEPRLRSATVEMIWPLRPAPSRAVFEQTITETPPDKRNQDIKCRWATRQIELLDRRGFLPDSAPIGIHGVQLGIGLRIIGMEGEAVAEWGQIIDQFYDGGITFPLGYTDGTGLYLPTSKMLDEGGYEVYSFWEYGYPAELAPGMEDIVLDALRNLRDNGIS
ncbi:MAG: hypothetical protein HY706_16500 [Candidatus Hydrogenedentes bacterium]|nr:hypothetical protein [Candidatus Hydrogenedentota bacterium]